MKKFQFGENWTSFSERALTAEHVRRAKADFAALIDNISIREKSFLDIGFGQGLTAAIALEMGANPVIAIDADRNCHAAYQITKSFFPDATNPEIITGSILDPALVESLLEKGPFEIVHSWGVLHHTGAMWKAMDNAASLVRGGGHLIISIYARHWTSPFWRAIKWIYVSAPQWVKKGLIAAFYPIMWLRAAQLGHAETIPRGMDFRHDLIDWIGGYPYEYASRDEIEEFLAARGFVPKKFIRTYGYTGCNEYIFVRSDSQQAL